MTSATAESLLAVLQRLAVGCFELKLKMDAAEGVFHRNNPALYAGYVREMRELQETKRYSTSEALVKVLRTQLVSG